MATATASSVSYNASRGENGGCGSVQSAESSIPESHVYVPVGVPIDVSATRTKTKSSGWFPFKRQKQRREKILAPSQPSTNGVEVIVTGGSTSPVEAVGKKKKSSNPSSAPPTSASNNHFQPFPTEQEAPAVLSYTTVNNNQNRDPDSCQPDPRFEFTAYGNSNGHYRNGEIRLVENGQSTLNKSSDSSIDCYVINSSRPPPPKFQAVPPPPSEIQSYETLERYTTAGKSHSLKKVSTDHHEQAAEVNRNESDKFNTLPIVPQPSLPAPPPPPERRSSPPKPAPPPITEAVTDRRSQSESFRYLKNLQESRPHQYGPRKDSIDTKPAFLKAANKEGKTGKSQKKEVKKPKKDNPQTTTRPFLMEIEKLEKATAKTAEQTNWEFRTLEEELLAVGDEPPMVARSTVRGAVIDTERHKTSRQRQHCLFGQEVYDQMLKNSLSVCEDLQANLDDYIVEVRSSPAREIPKRPGAENGSPPRPVSSPTAPEIVPQSMGNGGTFYSVDEDPNLSLEARDPANKQAEKMGTLKKTIESNGEGDVEKKHKRKVFRLKFP